MKPNDALEELEWWNSLTEAEQEASFVLTDEQKAELDRRIAQHEADPSSAVPWEEVRQRLMARFGDDTSAPDHGARG
jgi:putative addiction module component (TIGR02574 family)